MLIFCFLFDASASARLRTAHTIPIPVRGSSVGGRSPLTDKRGLMALWEELFEQARVTTYDGCTQNTDGRGWKCGNGERETEPLLFAAMLARELTCAILPEPRLEPTPSCPPDFLWPAGLPHGPPHNHNGSSSPRGRSVLFGVKRGGRCLSYVISSLNTRCHTSRRFGVPHS
jgi:hypothetical protein